MKDELFAELAASVKEGGAILRGEKEAARTFHLDPLDIKHIRESYHLTQEKFAAMLGISVRTLRNWEQGRRVPEGPAMVLLRVADKHPEAVLDAIRIGKDAEFKRL
ncbi:MAG TPA: helix-turn-helix domain-containing protein [Anaerolineaceae bacterium]|nr:helix-turn-helix domain-containing protein [Anaerolineaceae bacterium]